MEFDLLYYKTYYYGRELINNNIIILSDLHLLDLRYFLFIFY